jgi:hypothetical protein
MGYFIPFHDTPLGLTYWYDSLKRRCQSERAPSQRCFKRRQ